MTAARDRRRGRGRGPSAWRTLVLVASLGTSCAVSHAAPPTRKALDQAVIAADAALQARLDDCRRRFVAAACEEAARAEHRDRIAALRRRQVELDEADRRRAADARRDELAARASERAARDRATASAAASGGPGDDRSESPSRKRDGTSPPPSGFPAIGRGGAAPADRSRGPTAGTGASSAASDRAARERRSLERHDERQREIATHRAAVERREAARAAAGKVAPLLPDPASGPSR